LVTAVAVAASTQAGVTAAQASVAGGRPVTNPFSRIYKHPYLRDAFPSVPQLRKMRLWARTHRMASFNSTAPLTYHGGIDGIGVTSGHEKVYLVFYGSQWGTQGTNSHGDLTLSGDPSGEAPYLQEFLKGLGTDNETWSGVATQYCQGVATGANSCPASNPSHVAYPAGGALAGVWADESTAAPAQATSHQLAQEAVNGAAHFGNTTAVTNREAQYVIVSPPGTNPEGLFPSYCGRHDYSTDPGLGGGPVTSPYGDLAFTNFPYVPSQSGCGAGAVNSPGTLDGVSIVEGHEYTETITDQNLGGGWYGTNTDDENGDRCAWIPPGTPGGMANLTLATGTFPVQSTWANDANGGAGACDISHPIVTDPQPAQSSNVSPSWHPNGIQANVFYVGANRQIYSWYWTGSAWTNNALGNGEAAKPGTRVAGVWQPNGTAMNVFYTGANGQIYNWWYHSGTWTNSALGNGQAAEPGTGVVGVWQPNGTAMNVFYTGANGQIYNWWYHGGTWTNSALGNGQAAESGTGISAAWQPNGTAANVFYTGANGQIYNWWYHSGTWTNAAVGNGEAAESGTGVAAAWQPNGIRMNVFYTGANGQTYSWYWTGSVWVNAALGNGAAAESGTGISAAWQPNGTAANVFYTGANGQIYNWWYHSGTWTNAAVGNGEAAEPGTGVPAVWQPNGTAMNVFYTGANGQIYNWWYHSGAWTNGQL
jgi:hypothetical protein